MVVRNVFCAFMAAVFLSFAALAAGQEKDVNRETLQGLKQEIEALRKQMEDQRKLYELQMQKMQQKLDALSREPMKKDQKEAEAELEAEVAKKTAQAPEQEPFWKSMGKAVQRFNPQIGVSIDTFYQKSDTDDGVGPVLGSVAGFGEAHEHDHGGEHQVMHAHGEDGDSHDHGAFNEGFNLREVELYMSAAVDPYFAAYTTISFQEEGVELEEAAAYTTGLPYGFGVLAGRFFSRFGYINQQHPHAWDFVDRPLIYQLAFGGDGLVQTGALASWLAPTPFHLLFGLEIANGQNEKSFNNPDSADYPFFSGPNLWTAWIKGGPNLPGGHELSLGVFGANGRNQQLFEDEEEGEHDLYSGWTQFYGGDVVYKYSAGREGGWGDFKFQGEYFRRDMTLTLEESALEPQFIGRDHDGKVDGLYAQAVYGFLPRFRAGLRYDVVGLINQQTAVDGDTSDFGDSWRLSGMIDWSPTEFSRLRLQGNWNEYELTDGEEEDFYQVFLQLIVNFGSHGAHGW